jgi:hypothetical protein
VTHSSKTSDVGLGADRLVRQKSGNCADFRRSTRYCSSPAANCGLTPGEESMSQQHEFEREGPAKEMMSAESDGRSRPTFKSDLCTAARNRKASLLPSTPIELARPGRPGRNQGLWPDSQRNSRLHQSSSHSICSDSPAVLGGPPQLGHPMRAGHLWD